MSFPSPSGQTIASHQFTREVYSKERSEDVVEGEDLLLEGEEIMEVTLKEVRSEVLALASNLNDLEGRSPCARAYCEEK